MILNLKAYIPNYKIYGELARYPVEIDITLRIIFFWSMLVFEKQSKTSCIMNSLLHCLYSQQHLNIKWMKKIEKYYAKLVFVIYCKRKLSNAWSG